jgi:hypothetical protein
MEQWQIDALSALLQGEDPKGSAVDIHEKRVYLSSPWYGQSRYHVITRDWDQLIIDQCDHGEKYQQRIILEEPEFAPFLRRLLRWHFEAIQESREPTPQATAGDSDDPDEVDERPF